MIQTVIQVFEAQQKNKYKLRSSSAKDRIGKLKNLKAVIEELEDEVYAALYADLRKGRFETALMELIFTYGEIDFAIRNLKGWMKPRYVGKSMGNIFAKNRIYYEPKGVCLIISPWNYPIQLTIDPSIKNRRIYNAL